MANTKHGDITKRAKRFVILHAHYGHGFVVCQKHTNLPSRLAAAIRILFFGNEENGSVLPREKWERGIDLALEQYRSYYRERARSNKKLAEG